VSRGGLRALRADRVAGCAACGVGTGFVLSEWDMDPNSSPGLLDDVLCPPPTLIGSRLGNCVVKRRLAQGGMGEIYLASQDYLRRQVAVKVPRLDGRSLDLHCRCLEAEARYLARIQHVNVVQVFDMGLAGPKLPYLVLELLSGRSLDKVLCRTPRLSVNNALRIIREAARGLAACHRAGIVCVDVKPENLMLVDGPLVGGAQRGSVWVKVIDLGAALPMDPDGQIPPRERVVGTPEYTAPEIVRGEAFDQRADVYALGTLLFELLTARAPFRGGRPSEVLFAQVSRPPPELHERTPMVTAGDPLDVLVADCLAKDPNRRPDSMLELLKRLDHVTPNREADGRKTPHEDNDATTRRLSQVATVMRHTTVEPEPEPGTGSEKLDADPGEPGA